MAGATDTALGQSRVYRSQGATDLVVASGGRLLVEAGGNITMPNTLARGYISLEALGAKTTATASGIVALTTGTQPGLANPDVTSGFLRYRWTSAAGSLNPLYFAPVRVPNNLATAGGLEVVVVGEGASANATNELNIAIRAGTATANIGSTRALTSSPVESTMAVTSGNTPATGVLNVSIFPSGHASGPIDLYSVGITYQKRTS